MILQATWQIEGVGLTWGQLITFAIIMLTNGIALLRTWGSLRAKIAIIETAIVQGNKDHDANKKLIDDNRIERNIQIESLRRDNTNEHQQLFSELSESNKTLYRIEGKLDNKR